MKTKASVKVMRSYDYCHFEVCLSTDELLEVKEINSMRIQAAKLVDKSIADYQAFKNHETKMLNNKYDREQARRKAMSIKENYPKSEWTPEQMATVKAYEDFEWDSQFVYPEWEDEET